MDTLTLLKLLIQEEKYPYFSDEDLNGYLLINGNDVNLTASKLCLMKADMEKTITVGPITIQNADPSFWIHLSDMYSTDSQSKNDPTPTGGYYKTSMLRSDEYVR